MFARLLANRESHAHALVTLARQHVCPHRIRAACSSNVYMLAGVVRRSGRSALAIGTVALAALLISVTPAGAGAQV